MATAVGVANRVVELDDGSIGAHYFLTSLGHRLAARVSGDAGPIGFLLLCWEPHWSWALCWEQQPTPKWAHTRYGLPWPSPRSWRSPSSDP